MKSRLFCSVLASISLAFFSGCSQGFVKEVRHVPLHAEVLDVDRLAHVVVLEVEEPRFEKGIKQEVWKDYFDSTIAGVWRKETAFDLVTTRDKSEAVPEAQLTTLVRVAEDRVGSQVGALRPAQLQFNQTIVSKASGKVLWRAMFVFKDKALTDNLFHTHQGRWEDLRALSKDGFQQAAAHAAEVIRGYYIKTE